MSGPVLGSTYRLQLNGLGLKGAAAIVPYLAELGIETVYLSPILTAAPGSTHGYDVVDPTHVDPALGSDEDLLALFDDLAARDMGVLLDIVPNHMATDPANAWWWDVLRRGMESPDARVFDIDWSCHEGRVLVPTLGRPLAEALADSTCVVEHDTLVVDDQRFPLGPVTPGNSAVEILELQHYRPAYWRTGDTEGNYRRFFDIGSLIGVCVEDPDVFTRTHGRIVAISAHPAVVGVRVDHIDGLADPRAYLVRLRRTLDGTGRDKALFVEKILAADESLDPRWPVTGTTGYEFADRALAVFLDAQGCDSLLKFGAELVGARDPSFVGLSMQAKREVLDRSFSGDLDRLTRRTCAALDRTTPGHDLSWRDLRLAWVELTVHLSVYRTYLEGGEPTARDRTRLMDAAAAGASGRLHSEVQRSLLALKGALLGPLSGESPWLEVARRWQQLSGAVMAKGSEDTATYRWSGLPVLADVGGEPDLVVDAVAAFHELMMSPGRGLHATSTHDSKRNEDARCRLAVLSEAADEWATLVTGWHAQHVANGGGSLWPQDELTAYESLYALWPSTAERPDPTIVGRVGRYVVKAAREAKLHSSWTDPDEGYEDAIASFLEALLTQEDFRSSMASFCRATAPAALSNVLALVVLKTWAPGVPDFYQGTELVAPTLTDPDNRGPVDFSARRALLESLPESSAAGAAELLASWPDGRLKLYVTRTLLHERRRHPELFAGGSYEPLEATTTDVVAFLRRQGERAVLAAVPRLTKRLVGSGRFATGDDPWGDAEITLADGSPSRYRDLLTGQLLNSDSGRLRLGDLLRFLPVAALRAEPGP